MFARAISHQDSVNIDCVCRSEGMEGGEISTLNIAVAFNLSHNERD